MNYVIVSTLRKGVVRERCSEEVNERIGAMDRAVQERDPPLTIEELWLMQGKACGFFKNGKRRRTAA